MRSAKAYRRNGKWLFHTDCKTTLLEFGLRSAVSVLGYPQQSLACAWPKY